MGLTRLKSRCSQGFLSGSSSGESYSLPVSASGGCKCSLASEIPSSIFKSSNDGLSPSPILSLPPLLSPSSTFKESHDYFRPTWIIQNSLSILRSTDWLVTLIPSTTLIPPFHLIWHSYRFQRLGCRHLCKGVPILPTALICSLNFTVVK